MRGTFREDGEKYQEALMKTKGGRTRGRQGFALMYCAIALTVLTVFCGLAIDATVLFMVRAKLSGAVDAAALAGARSVNLGSTQAEAQTSAYTAADTFFLANFPNGYLGSQAITMPAIGSTNTSYDPSFSQSNSTGLITMQVTAQVQAPIYFMRILGFQNITVSAAGTAKRRALVMMLVLDISSSMGNGAGSSCAAMVTAAQSFVTMFSPYDEIGLITFDLTAHLKDTPTTSHASGSTLYNDIGAISCGSNTNTISALDMAYQQIKAQNLPLALNTIVLFTDGSPNGITATFAARAAADTRYGPQYVNPPASPNACSDTAANGTSYDNNNEYSTCNMPVLCTNAADTMFGSIAQWGNQNSWGANTVGLAQPADYGAYAATNTDNQITLPTSCGAHQSDLSGGGTSIRNFIAYIPDTDFYGNNLRHGVAVTAGAPAAQAEVLGGWDTRENWLFQQNLETNGAISKNTGAVWRPTYNTTGTASNFFSAGPYINKLRPDQPNTIVAASMNGAMSEAARIRSDATYNPVIHTIYLTGNALDSVDHEFLAIIANVQQITDLPYDANYQAPPNDPIAWANPAYQSTQQSGKYLVTSNNSQLSQLFAILASEVLRLSK
jgi:Flp pilus assembly protein TadG